MRTRHRLTPVEGIWQTRCGRHMLRRATARQRTWHCGGRATARQVTHAQSPPSSVPCCRLAVPWARDLPGCSAIQQDAGIRPMGCSRRRGYPKASWLHCPSAHSPVAEAAAMPCLERGSLLEAVEGAGGSSQNDHLSGKWQEKHSHSRRVTRGPSARPPHHPHLGWCS